MDDINQPKPIAKRQMSRLVIAMYVMQAVLVLIAAGALIARLVSPPQPPQQQPAPGQW